MEKEKKIDLVKQNKYFVKGDIIVFAALAVLVTFLTLLVFRIYGSDGREAHIFVNGQLHHIMPLRVDAEYRYGNGDDFCLIVVDGGYISVKDDSTPNKIGQKMGKTNKIGKDITVKPLGIVIKIVGKNSTAPDDILNLKGGAL